MANSIAISVIVYPSLWLKILCGAACCLCCCLAIALALPLQSTNASLILRLLASAIALFGAAAAGKQLFRQRRAWLLDITGAADIRLSTLPCRPPRFSRPGFQPDFQLDPQLNHKLDPQPDMPLPAETRFLAAGSFISPLLMVLRLADKHDNINTLLIFPDSVSLDAFRRLALACRWLAAHRQRRQPDIPQ